MSPASTNDTDSLYAESPPLKLDVMPTAQPIPEPPQGSSGGTAAVAAAATAGGSGFEL